MHHETTRTTEHIDKDWVKNQLAKGIAAEESLLKAEKDHRDRLHHPEITKVYDEIIVEDEKHLDALKRAGGKYGYESGGVMQGAGGLLGGLKSAVESVGTSDPFQTIGDDLMLKSNALNYDIAWTKIFRDIGDTEGSHLMDEAAREDEKHQKMLRECLTSVGLMEARGEEIEED